MIFVKNELRRPGCDKQHQKIIPVSTSDAVAVA